MENIFKSSLTQKLMLILLSLAFNGCSMFYAPNLPNIPLFSDEEDTNLNLSSSLLGTEFQASRKIFDDFAVIANYQKIKTNDDNGGSYNSNLFEVGCGWLLTGNEHKRLEIFAGSGIGNVDMTTVIKLFNLNPDSYSAKGNLQKYFLQIDMGTSFKFLETALMMRFVNVNFSNLQLKNYPFVPATNVSYFDIGVMLRIGPPKVKLQSFLGWSKSIGDKTAVLDYMPLIYGIGVNVKF